MTRHVHAAATRFGQRFTIHLIRSLQHEDPLDRESITWLLILLDDQEAIPHLQSMARNEQFSRSPTPLSRPDPRRYGRNRRDDPNTPKDFVGIGFIHPPFMASIHTPSPLCCNVRR